MRWTPRARRLGIGVLCAAGFALGSWNWLWEQMPWAV